MLFPLTNFPPWIWSLTGWVGEFKTCLGGVLCDRWEIWMEVSSPCSGIYVAFPGMEKKHLHTWKHPNQASFKIPILPRQGSNSAPLGGLLCQIPYTVVAYDSQIPMGCPAGGRRGRGVMKLRIDERITARTLMTWNGQMFSNYCGLCSRLKLFQFMRKNTWWVELFQS